MPQFCRKDRSGDLQPAMAITFWSNIKFPTGEQFVWVPTADMVDVECAAVASTKLALRLNAYAEKLVLDHMRGHGFKVQACGGKYTLSPAARSMDGQKHTLFHLDRSKNPDLTAKQRPCITAYAPVQQPCAADG